jgi:hypothetical protein
MTLFKPKDIIAIIVIGAMVIFKLTGHNGTLDTVVALIVGYYFAHRSNGQDDGK